MENKAVEKKVMVSFQVPVSFKNKIDVGAKEEGLLVSRYIRERLEVGMDFGPKVRAMLNELSKTHGMTESEIVNSILAAYLADLIFLREKYPDSPIVAVEFTKSSRGPLGEDALLKLLRDDRLRDFRIKELLDKG